MYLSALFYLVFLIPLALFLGFYMHWGAMGSWTAVAIVNISAACVFAWRLHWQMQQKRGVVLD